MTAPAETGTFTVGVFKDLEWAARGLDALARHRFTPEMLSLVVKESGAAAALVERTFGRGGDRMQVTGLDTVLAIGPLVAALDGADRALAPHGLSGTMARAGFQPHDAEIFQRLAAKGGVLVAISSDPRAADAIAVLHAYGAGNATIGAWVGRL